MARFADVVSFSILYEALIFYLLIFSRAWCVHTVLTTVTYTVANESIYQR
jgi:hypothetical protein